VFATTVGSRSEGPVARRTGTHAARMPIKSR
jgi:hypothetical protein